MPVGSRQGAEPVAGNVHAVGKVTGLTLDLRKSPEFDGVSNCIRSPAHRTAPSQSGHSRRTKARTSLEQMALSSDRGQSQIISASNSPARSSRLSAGHAERIIPDLVGGVRPTNLSEMKQCDSLRHLIVIASLRNVMSPRKVTSDQFSSRSITRQDTAHPVTAPSVTSESGALSPIHKQDRANYRTR